MQDLFQLDHSPKRIVCLTDESVETLYLLGEENRIVGISGFTRRPPQARKTKPIVSTFTQASIDEIKDLQPDLVLGYSDVQAQMAKDLILEGLSVWILNHRSVKGILSMIQQLGQLLGKGDLSKVLVDGFLEEMAAINETAKNWNKRPRVYFEEWDDPLICGIQWVSEIMEIAGGTDVFASLSRQPQSKNRTLHNPEIVLQESPDIILASWCGKKVKKENILQRPAWRDIPALQQDDIFEIPSSIILQPGPAALSEGLPMIHRLFQQWVDKQEG